MHDSTSQRSQQDCMCCWEKRGLILLFPCFFCVLTCRTCMQRRIFNAALLRRNLNEYISPTSSKGFCYCTHNLRSLKTFVAVFFKSLCRELQEATLCRKEDVFEMMKNQRLLLYSFWKSASQLWHEGLRITSCIMHSEQIRTVSLDRLLTVEKYCMDMTMPMCFTKSSVGSK